MELPETTAGDVMTENVQTVAPDDDVGDVLGRLARADFNGFPAVEDGELVGIVTQGDLVDLFQTEERTLWVPVGLPPFVETVHYAVDVSWDDLDLGVDLAANVNRPVREVMTGSVVTVGPRATLDRVVSLLADESEDINRLPVVEGGELVGILTREDALRAVRDRL